MRTVLIVIVSLAVGLGGGYGLTKSEFNGVEERFAGRLTHQPKKEYEIVDEIAEVVLLNGDEFDFGSLQRHQARRHSFRIKNGGLAMLRLQYYGRSCGQCIATSFKGGEFARGETVEIEVEYRTAKPDEDYVHYVEFATNDETFPMLRLYVKGKVTERVRLSQTELQFDKVSASESKEEAFRVYGYFTDQLEVVSHKFTNPETADRFELEYTPLDVDTLDMNPKPKAAMEVLVRVKEGMPVGQINQTVSLSMMAGEEVVAHMHVEGEVASDFSLRGGRDFNGFRNLLKFGNVVGEVGASSTVHVFIRGPHRDRVELKVESVDPSEVLKVEIGEAQSVANGLVLRVPITLSIPPGAPVMNRGGSDQGNIAKIAIATTHPDAKQLMIYASFIVE